ncbi:hypothetical protein [Candidatus Aalborgicola defluviihabitans]|uniref:hypothetical protein n=1 Tax=Candidatus Aalborgicola defluviihabitans TaxID=3386187 RepID=UPI001DF3E9E2|nr:hypothetical protein [Burkholderiales bacterium]
MEANEKLTLRAGLKLADNPIPADAPSIPLFLATVKNHATLVFVPAPPQTH